MAKAIIFIPRSPFLDYDRVMPFLGPMYLKSFLESKGHIIDIDDSPDKDNIPDLEKYDFISISSTTPQYFSNGHDFAKAVKEKYPEKKIIIGGAHARNYYQEIIEEGIFSHIVRGDGEFAFLDILDGKELPLVINAGQLNSEQMGSFPLPWRDKEFLSKYTYFIEGKKATTVMASRYCPMRCKFCEERDSNLTLYPMERLDKELEEIKNLGYEAVMFYDDILPLSKERTEKICELTKKHGIIFRCNGHVRTMSHQPELLKIMKDAGCVEICLGIESTDQRILDIVDKGNKVEEIFQATRNVLNSGLKLSAYLIIGLPGESKESIANTEKYIAEFSGNPLFTFDYTIFYPYRHTYIRENLQEFDLQVYLEGSTGAYKQAGGISECCISTSSLSQEDIVKERERIIEKYKHNFRGYASSNLAKSSPDQK